MLLLPADHQLSTSRQWMKGKEILSRASFKFKKAVVGFESKIPVMPGPIPSSQAMRRPVARRAIACALTFAPLDILKWTLQRL
jgi:hypothetical protein